MQSAEVCVCIRLHPSRVQRDCCRFCCPKIKHRKTQSFCGPDKLIFPAVEISLDQSDHGHLHHWPLLPHSFSKPGNWWSPLLCCHRKDRGTDGHRPISRHWRVCLSRSYVRLMGMKLLLKMAELLWGCSAALGLIILSGRLLARSGLLSCVASVREKRTGRLHAIMACRMRR